MVSREEHVPFGSIYTRDIEQNCRFVIPPETGINRMDVKSQNFQTNSKCLQNASSSMFHASTLNHQVPKYFSWTLDPQAVGMDAFSVNWNKGLLYIFPPFSLIQKCRQKIIEDKATVLFITPVWQSRPWYPMLLNLLYDRPLLLPHNPQILKLPWSQTVHPLFQNRKFHLAFVRRSFKDKKFSERVCKILQASWKLSTEKQYQSAWKQFFSWCSQRSCDPFSCSLNIILDYLVDLFYKGLEYRTIK